MAQGTVQVTHTGTSRWRRRTGEYASLAAALQAAADGDVLTVAPGTYRENLVVQRPVTLRGPEGAPGSVRIASNVPPGLPNVAYRTPEGRTVLIVLNDGDAERTFSLRDGGEIVSATLPAGAVGTFVWR